MKYITAEQIRKVNPQLLYFLLYKKMLNPFLNNCNKAFDRRNRDYGTSIENYLSGLENRSAIDNAFTWSTDAGNNALIWADLHSEFCYNNKNYIPIKFNIIKIL